MQFLVKLRDVALVGLCFGLFFFSSCAAANSSISDIVSNPSKYVDQKVTLSGEYRGWESGHGSPPVTRSDWVLKDGSGSIYVTGKTPALDPVKDIGKPVTVDGTVRIKGSQVYLEAETVR